jgi:hypothetical protein
MRGPYVILVLIALAILGGLFLVRSKEVLAPITNPDTTTLTSGVRGMVLLGPQCPVVQAGTPCPDKPYSTTIRIFRLGSNSPLAITTSNGEGVFQQFLEPGMYTVTPQAGTPFPTCESVVVTVSADTITDVTLSCDTGIR